MNSRGEILLLHGIGQGNGSQPALAPLVAGSGGRLGIVVGVRVSTFAGVGHVLGSDTRQPRTMSTGRDAAVLRSDLISMFDPDGVFAW
jgi:hypothetical protein